MLDQQRFDHFRITRTARRTVIDGVPARAGLLRGRELAAMYPLCR